MSEFIELVNQRRSASNFLPDNPITKKELDEIFNLVKLGPSAFNLQHTNYVVVLDPEKKQKLKEAANGQYKVESSSAVVLVLGDKQAFQQAADIYKGLNLLGVINKQEYDLMVNDTVSFYEKRGQEFHRDEAIRNASLSAMLFMLAAKEKGWDTCPMIGFDSDKVKEALNVPAQYEAVLMITIGKEKTESRKPRGYRRPINEFVSYQ
ncbi:MULTISPECIES: nitroreductase family protein [Terribacillus]|jgi:putative NAD(P)H nitroreductase|uniref:Nitroreductase family protein n=1 Tax=Terribacillus saccharophilus TaxID=361277 RepID=A0ABX4GW29_9BACI|nr:MULTISPECIES: nitroreductase family protein [Terribacillus]PAD34759.1 nitroreductase family protein [Terribacillus saccharophilus]PAD95507.1 nitroreductase family protein [Terribacillus saccharophilus]PAD99085.1 nitroreductase family protein [Terribacillus saccharophilus]